MKRSKDPVDPCCYPQKDPKTSPDESNSIKRIKKKETLWGILEGFLKDDCNVSILEGFINDPLRIEKGLRWIIQGMREDAYPIRVVPIGLVVDDVIRVDHGQHLGHLSTTGKTSIIQLDGVHLIGSLRLFRLNWQWICFRRITIACFALEGRGVGIDQCGWFRRRMDAFGHFLSVARSSFGFRRRRFLDADFGSAFDGCCRFRDSTSGQCERLRRRHHQTLPLFRFFRLRGPFHLLWGIFDISSLIIHFFSNKSRSNLQIIPKNPERIWNEPPKHVRKNPRNNPAKIPEKMAERTVKESGQKA